MNDFDFSAFVIFLIITIIWLLPYIIIISSRKTVLTEKILWLVAVTMFSWLALIFYFLLAPVLPKK